MARLRPAAVLITEQQVAFSTAAAASLAPTRRRRWTAIVSNGLGRILAVLTKRRSDTARERSYIQTARMSREMDRP